MKPSFIVKYSLLIYLLLSFVDLKAQDLHRKFADLPCFNKNFNTIVHVAVDSLHRDPIAGEIFINQMLEETSEFFAPICLSFTSCEINVIEDNYAYSNLQDSPISLTERIEKMTSLYHKPRRINIFIVDSIQNIECGLGEFEGIKTQDAAIAIIELNNCPDKKPSQNLAHQLGHLFGLYDTFENNHPAELVDGSNCETAGDFICDTPADPYFREISIPGTPDNYPKNYLNNCEFIFRAVDQNGEYYQPDVGNIMSAYPCKCGFTREQYLKMADVYFNSSVKQF